ncbi:GNAT family N-acetyltransferase [Paenibacillus silviterrae]|uniref:GNAT family N-acetyltransferase n=1 Tax=Paenibacillus silviterrae TaxID=3242194 RepID=UPI0025435989|nr:GNAT family N-acetyltransferase [Paenibacillus chinjuensis]
MAGWGWTDEQSTPFIRMQWIARERHYSDYYPQAKYYIILIGGDWAGTCLVESSDMHIRIVDIALLAAFRNQGWGTLVLQHWLDKARVLGVPVLLSVNAANRAIRLYQRLGFQITETSETQIAMEWAAT